jgi:phosphodiesterase/alkaline phosphatase D-like protein
MLSMLKSRDDLIREEMDYFRNIVRNGTSAPHQEWERRANLLDGLLPDEEFYLRFIEKMGSECLFSIGERVAMLH